MNSKALVGLSGGIDSTVSAYLLKEKGFEVEGITMLIWKKDSPYPAPKNSNCCYKSEEEEDLEEIDKLCKKIGIKHHVVDISFLYEETVLKNFRDEYLNGKTPNPCLWCNTLIKFGAMVEKAREFVDFDYFATGHYAKINENKKTGRFELLKAIDLKKDQSYFLSRLSQEQLQKTLFPLGNLKKSEVRALDEKLGFHKPGQTESQDFYGGDYSDLLNTKEKKGNIVLIKENKVLGEHSGFWHYTIGQRKGLGVSYREPLYVISLDKDTNTVFVGPGEETRKSVIKSDQINYVSDDKIDSNKEYSVKIRSASPGFNAKVIENNGEFIIMFFSPVSSAAPGQAAVIYDGDKVIASSIIK